MTVHHDRSEIERTLEMVQLLQAMNGIQSEFVSVVRGMQVNGLLWSGSGQIPTSGFWAKTFNVPFAFVHVVNLAADLMTVTNAGVEEAAPAYGIGIKKVPGGASLGFNLVGNHLVIYGAAGDTFNLEVHIKPERGS